MTCAVSPVLSWGWVLKLFGGLLPLLCPDLPPGWGGWGGSGAGRRTLLLQIQVGDPRLPSPEHWAPLRSRQKLKL